MLDRLKNKNKVKSICFSALVFAYFITSWIFQYNQSIEVVKRTLITGSWWQIALTLIMAIGVFLQFPIIIPIVAVITALNIIDFNIAGRSIGLFILVTLFLDLWYSYYFVKFLGELPTLFKNKRFGVISGLLVVVTVVSVLSAIILWRNKHVTRDDSNSPILVDEQCVNKNGVNQTNGYRKEVFTCKNGQLDGWDSRYDENGNLDRETNYVNGMKEGLDIGYGDLGNTYDYKINKTDKVINIYEQEPEKAVFQSAVYRKTDQNEICAKKSASSGPNLIYKCVDNVFDGIYQDNSGPVVERARLKQGLLDGTFERKVRADVFDDLYHVEFKDGVLHGHIYHYDFGQLVYDGQYVNGLQEGVFKTFSLGGERESEIEFHLGKIKKIIYSRAMERSENNEN